MFNKNKKRVIVGMSGGVDSSVAAWLMQKQGYQVEGLFMKNWEEDDDENNCIASDDLADAQSVCNTLNINLHKINFATEYWEKVFKNFLEEYKIGRTPNPDILCNKEIKFKVFLEFAIDELGADFITTGHYVRKQYINGNHFLLRSFDSNKDQSYFLYTLNSQQISKSLFPIGNFRKSEVRRIAEKLHFITAKKKDSTGICFIGKRNFCDFLKRYLPCQTGNIENLSGEIIGKHQGVIYYTLGQRKGLNIGGCKNGNRKPWYVIDKDVINNRLIVAQGSNHPKLLSIGLIAQQLHWINNQLITSKLRCTVKTRYRQADIPCEIIQTSDKHIEVRFDYPVAAVTPGQSAVFYLGEICLGGGIIEQRLLND